MIRNTRSTLGSGPAARARRREAGTGRIRGGRRLVRAGAQLPDPGPVVPALDNEGVAQSLEQVAGLLEDQDANPFRVRAYRRGADVVRALPQSAAELLRRQGLAGLTHLHGIGDSLARSIEQLVHSGHLPLLDHLQGHSRGHDVFTSVPGVGPKLARRVHEDLGLETLAELEAAAYDGRLASVPGFGSRRVRAVRESLSSRFRQPPPPRAVRGPELTAAQGAPEVSELLDVDAQYRREARAERLPLIAPRRFNPGGHAWLPILHTRRGERHYTALFSNTARAHELGTTGDWVVLYRDDPGGDGQWTVVTARLGALRGRRIVRGRERECARHYAAASLQPAARPAGPPGSRFDEPGDGTRS